MPHATEFRHWLSAGVHDRHPSDGTESELCNYEDSDEFEHLTVRRFSRTLTCGRIRALIQMLRLNVNVKF
jgi:hypothetical protein